MPNNITAALKTQFFVKAVQDDISAKKTRCK